jgi:hypothetical protein
MSRSLLRTRSALVVALAGLALLLGSGCGDPNCEEQSCADFGGAADRTLFSCYSSGSGSVDDEFWVQDSNEEEFFRCTRPADDNDGCGVELLIAKETYCAP